MSIETPTKTEVGMQEASTQKAMEEQVAIEKAAFKQVTDWATKAKKVQTLGDIAQAADTQAASNDLKRLDEVFPELKWKRFNEPGEWAWNKAPAAAEAATPAVRDAIAAVTQPGTQPQDVGKNLEKVFSSLPKGLQDFFKGIFGLFMNLAKMDTQEKQVKLDNIKDDGQKIFDKYGVKTRNEGATAIAEFGKDTKIRAVHTNPNAKNTNNNTWTVSSSELVKPVELDTITGAKEGQQKVAGMTNMYTDRIPGTSGGGPG